MRNTVKKFLGVASILILLNGCSAIIAMPLPLRIANNIHTAITVIQNVDKNPDNDSWMVNSVKELIKQE